MPTRNVTIVYVDDENQIADKSMPSLVSAMFEQIARQLSAPQLAIIAGIFALVAFAGIVVIGQGITTLRTGAVSANWPHVMGKMLKAEVTSSTTQRRDNEGRSYTDTTYYPSVTYEFVLNGQTYQSNRLSAQDNGYSKSTDALNAIEQVNSGDGVTVYYNPQNPKEAMLKPGISGNSFVSLVFGGLLLLLGGGVIVWLVRVFRRKPAKSGLRVTPA